MKGEDVKNICYDFMNSRYWTDIVNKYKPIIVYIGGSYKISANQGDVDICIISDFFQDYEIDRTLCFQYFFKETDNKYNHVDVLITPSNNLVGIDNIFMAGIQKIFFDLNDRIIYTDNNYKKTLELLSNPTFIEKCKTIALLGLFDELSISLIEYITGKDKNMSNKSQIYALYYCYCRKSGKPVDTDMLEKLKNAHEDNNSYDFTEIFTEIVDYCLKNPEDTISLKQSINEQFFKAVGEDNGTFNK